MLRPVSDFEPALDQTLVRRSNQLVTLVFFQLYQAEKEQRHLAEKNLRDETQANLNEMQKKWETELTEVKKKNKVSNNVET